MSPRAIFASLLLLGATIANPVVHAATECDAAQAELAYQVEQSPLHFTTTVANALGSAMDACDESSARIRPQVSASIRLSPNDLTCPQGMVEGLGPQVVMLWTAATGTVPYNTRAAIVYQRYANHDEFITSRDPTNTGFDVTQKDSLVEGSVVVAGLSFPADEADLDGDCPDLGNPCHAVGYVAYVTSQLQVWVYGDLEVCV